MGAFYLQSFAVSSVTHKLVLAQPQGYPLGYSSPNGILESRPVYSYYDLSYMQS